MAGPDEAPPPRAQRATLVIGIFDVVFIGADVTPGILPDLPNEFDPT